MVEENQEESEEVKNELRRIGLNRIFAIIRIAPAGRMSEAASYLIARDREKMGVCHKDI